MESNQGISDAAASQEVDTMSSGTSSINIATPVDSRVSSEEENDPEARNWRPWCRDEAEIRKIDIELYEFTKVDFETREMRFLIVQPHRGDPESLIYCSLSIEPLEKCEPYTALVNTRGNPFDTAILVVDNAMFPTQPNIWVYLNEIRDGTEPKRFWFRDVCINHRLPDEKAEYWNPEWMEIMNQHAEKVVDMSQVLAEMWDEGKLEPPFYPRPRDDRSYGIPNFQFHTPIPLALAAEYAKGVAGRPEHSYLPLDYVANETRVISISDADNFDDPLVGMIRYKPMHNQAHYTCVSYQWGTQPATELLELSGQSFLIRKNLATFLRTVRRPGNGQLIFWIDAVSIDQGNVAERNRQLPRMLEIYEDADIVTCWPGEPDEISDVALNLVLDLEPTNFYGGGIIFELGWLKVKDREDFPRRLAALYRFLCRPYFRRIWVAQEVAVARRPYIVGGKDLIVEWKRLDHAAWRLMDILYSDKDLVERIHAADPSLKEIPHSELSFARRLFYLRHLRHGRIDEIEENRNTIIGFAHKDEPWVDIPDSAPGILDVVTLCRDFKSTVPQDKVFALWNLATDTGDMDFTMDYTKNLSETWLEFAVAVAQKNGSLDIICAAEPNVAGLVIPSWCPDWSTPSEVSSLVHKTHIPITLMRGISDIGGSIYHAAGSKKLKPRFSFNGFVLECAGIILDTIGLIGPYEPSDASSAENPIWNDWMEMAAGALQSNEDAALPIFEQNFQARFWGMLSGTSEGGSQDLRRYIPGWDENQDALIKSNGRDMYPVVTKGRCLVITEDGFMGLAPHYVEEGAKIAILSCCSSPVILYENEDGTYTFGGSCFVQGWMRGEMLTRVGETEEEAWVAIDNMGRIKIV